MRKEGGRETRLEIETGGGKTGEVERERKRERIGEYVGQSEI